MDALLDPEDPLARALVDAIHRGAYLELGQLLAEHPGLARVRIGDASCSRSTLHVATDWPGHFPEVHNTIRKLVEAGADPSARFVGQAHGETPLHWAASSDDLYAVLALLNAGADIDAPGGVMADGSPLEDARIFAQWGAAMILVERGAATTIDDEAALGLEDRLVARLDGADQAALDQAFWYACHGGQLGTARMLFEAGADARRVAPWEPLTPLDAARRSQESNGIDASELIAWLESTLG